MPIAVVQEWPAGDHDTSVYDAVNERMGVRDNPPEGCLAHTAGFSDEGTWRLFDVWESQEHFERFMKERLMPAIGEVGEGGTPPQSVKQYDLYSFFTP
jgi:hypothetical protein